MVTGTPLDGAVWSWLVASLGDAVRDKLRLPSASRALRQVVEDAVAATVGEIAGHLDDRDAAHLRSVLLVREVGFDVDAVQVSNEAELREALHGWVAELDSPEFGQPGYLSALGVDRQRLAQVLSQRVVAGVWGNARAGGPLGLLAEWGWRDDTTVRLARIEEGVKAGQGVAGPVGGGLPGGTPDFTGRQEVLAELAKRVEAHDPAGVVVAIHAVDGMAGVGKTELALRAAHQHKHRYPDGQYFINLHGYTPGVDPMRPAAALEELLRQAGVPGQQIPPTLVGRQARWQALMVDRQALVLLDNALDADQVRPLLPSSAGCLVLVTSRTRLTDLPGARALPLDVLPPAEAVELFTRLVDADRTLDSHTAARMVELVGRLPVAVRAVASQIADDYTAAELAEDLARAKAHAELVEAASPQGTGVRAAFQTSLQRLDQSSRRAFLVLGVHPGPSIGVPQFAALAGLQPADARQVLRILAARNLITPAVDGVGHCRYQLHDLLRAYARQQAEVHLSDLERKAALARLAAWYTAVIAVVDELWDAVDHNVPTEAKVDGLSLAEPSDLRAWLVAEQDNLLAFADHASDHAADQDAAYVCHRYALRFHKLNHYAAAQALNQAAANIRRQVGDRDGEAEALWGLGKAALSTGAYPRAGEYLRAALTIYQQTGSRAGEASALGGLGTVARATGSYPHGGEYLRAALTIYQEIGDQAGEAYTLTGLGHVAVATGSYPHGGEYFRAALTIYQEIGDQDGEAYAVAGLGRVALATGDYRRADEHYRAALAIYQQIRNQNGEAYALNGLGGVARAVGDFTRAGERYRAALSTYQQIGNQDGEAGALTGLGHIARLSGDYPGAGELYRTALSTYQHIGARAGEADALAGLGDAAKLNGHHDEAYEQWQRALAICVEIGSPLAESIREQLQELDRS